MTATVVSSIVWDVTPYSLVETHWRTAVLSASLTVYQANTSIIQISGVT
jgi:hypothetical protein